MRLMIVLVASIFIVGGLFSARPSVARTSAGLQEGMTGPSSVSEGNDNFWMGWSLPVNVSQCPTNRATYAALGVADAGQTIYLAWTDGRASSTDVYYATSTDTGWHWEAPQAVLATDADSWRPSMVVSGTMPILAWAEATSSLNRKTYQLALGDHAPATVPNDHVVLAYAPRLALGPEGELHLALQGGLGTQPDILYSRRAAGATAWSTATVVFTHTASGSYNPAIAISADGQSVHMVWQENFSGARSDVYYLRGQRSGDDMLWEMPVSLSEGITRSVRPAIALRGETVHVVWGEQASGFEEQYISYNHSEDGGLNWSTPARVSSTPVSVNNVAPTDVAPTLAIAPSGALCVAWHGFHLSMVSKTEEIYLACSSDQVVSWGSPVNISRSPDIMSIRPVLAIGSDGVLGLAWQELAGSDPLSEYQVYYARSLPYSTMLPLVRK